MRTTSLRLLAAAALNAAAMCGWSAVAGAQGATLPGTPIVPGDADRTTRVGTRGANFLHVEVGARQVGMGGAAIVSSEGPSAIFWSPSNIAGREQLGVFLSYMQLFGSGSGISNAAAAITLPVGQGAIGIGLQQYSSGSIDRTTEAAPDGNDPVFPGTFSWTGTAISAHYARTVTDRLAAAVGVRYAREGIDFAHSNWVGADISTRFRTGLYGLSVAASILNMGSSGHFTGPAVGQAVRQPRYNGNATGRDIPITYRTKDSQMPTSFNFGILSSLYGDAEALFGSSPRHSLNMEVNFSDAIDTDLQTAIGLEYGFNKLAFARIGKRFFNEQHGPWKAQDGLSFGGGVRLPLFGRSMRLDYGYVVMGELHNNQVLSFDIGQ